jgi:hypothetical protein
MDKVITTTASITCPSSGTVEKTSDAKLQVGGNPVLLEGQVSSWTVKNCLQTKTNSGEVQCLTVSAPTKGTAAKLTVGGSKVLLDSLEATTNGKPKNELSTASGESKLQAS